MKYIYIILVSILVGAGLTYYLTPTKIKEVEKVVYKDKIVNQVKTEYKNGKIITITKTDVKEVEKEVEKIIEKVIKKERSVYVLPAIDLSGDKLIGVGFSNKLFLSFDFFISGMYNINTPSNSLVQVGLKYNF